MLVVGHFVWESEGVSREWRTDFIYCRVLVVGHFVWGCESAGCIVQNCMYFCVLVVGYFVWECEGLSGSGVLNCMYCCVGSWIFCVGV